MIVTAASSNHFKSAKQFLASVPEKVVFYDIGLTEEEAEEIKQLNIEYRKFDFSVLPLFAHLDQPCAGAYAWKPYIIDLCCQEDDMVIWFDAGDVVTDLKAIKDLVRKHGLYTPVSSGNVKKWTYETMLKEYEQFSMNIMRNAAVVGVFCRHPVMRRFIREWRDMALQSKYSIPEGSTRDNHRWDQSILTCLFYKYKIECPYKVIGVKIHQDCD